MNTQNINNSNNESINGMSQVVIDLRPQVKHQDGHGREVLADVHFRIDVQAYTANLYTYTKEAREESEKACEAYYSEVVELLKAEGWTLRKEKFGVGDCPQMVKGTQYLYCHPQDISGQVNPADIEALEAKIKTLTTCKYYNTDNYGDIIVTTSESDEKHLYRDTYADGLASIWQEVTTTKRSNLYKDKAEAEHCVRRRICIANRRADLNDIGTGSYNMRTPLLQFLMEEYDRLLQAGYIKEATGQNGRTLCRWINKKEEKELNKARREAEKAEKERKAQEWQEFLDREAEKQNSFTEGMRVTVPAASLTDGEAFVIVTIRRKAADNGGNASLTVKNETTGDVRNINGSDVSEILPALQPASEITEAEGIKVGDKVRHNKHEEVATVTAIREAFVNGCDGYRYLYTLDFGQSVKGPFDVELNGGEFLREAFTLAPDYYSEYQKLGHQEARPTEWIEKATSEEREAYYRACVELERMAGDGLPLVIRADSADLSANPWNALEKRVKTARVFHLGDRVKVKDGSREVTGIVNGIRCNEGSLALGGWCTHYNIQWDKQYQYTTGYGTVTGCGNIGPEHIELIERAEFCPEPTSEWLQPGEKVAHYLDYGDGTGDWLTGNVTGYDLDDNDKGVTVIYGEYRTPLKGMVKYQPEMDGKAA